MFSTRCKADSRTHAIIFRVLTSFQTQGFRDNYQKTFPDRESADAAWCAYMRDGSFPEYGCFPWVIFIGRWVGVTTRV